MTARTPEPPVRSVLTFLVLTFGIAWGLMGSASRFPVRSRRRLGRSGLAVSGTLSRDQMAQPPLGELLGAVAFMLVLGPMEEFGWRGYALALLQRVMAPIWSGLVLGLIWGLWHLPAFLLSGTPQSDWGFVPFLMGATAVSVIATGFFNACSRPVGWVVSRKYSGSPRFRSVVQNGERKSGGITPRLSGAGRLHLPQVLRLRGTSARLMAVGRAQAGAGEYGPAAAGLTGPR